MAASFFSKCPKCGVMVVTRDPCPNCRDHEPAEPPAEGEAPAEGAPVVTRGAALADEYQRRQAQHTRNYTIYMGLMAGTGVLGILTAICWFMFIFLGDVCAAFSLIPLNMGLFVLGYMVKFGKSMFPVEVFCPGCNTRLDEIGLMDGRCPGCHAKLR